MKIIFEKVSYKEYLILGYLYEQDDTAVEFYDLVQSIEIKEKLKNVLSQIKFVINEWVEKYYDVGEEAIYYSLTVRIESSEDEALFLLLTSNGIDVTL
jgi:hypothetical protein